MTSAPPPCLSAPALALALAALASACGTEADRPHVVLVVVDTLRADRMSLYGYDRETTPALDTWAREGAVFERAWSACSWTTPSMAMLMTGRARAENSGRLVDGELSLAELLQRAGYRTGAFVDNPLLTPQVAGEGLGFDRGFDDYALRRPPRSKAERNGRTARRVVDEGLAWADGVLAAGDDPFFLFLHLFDPHDPYAPEGGLRFEPRSSEERAAAFRQALPAGERELLDAEAYAGIERRLALYESEVLQTDRGLARLFAWLEERGLGEDTLVVLTSDHGEGLWQRAASVGEEHKPDAFFPWLYFDHGVQLYSEQVHVPLVLRGPGVEPGRRVSADVSTLDVVPTVLSLLDLAAPPGLDGVDLSKGAPTERAIYAFCSRGSTWTESSAAGRWRLHAPREYRIERHGAVPELYDLAADPHELAPLPLDGTGPEAQRALGLARALEVFAAARAGAAGAEQRSVEQQALMRAMGYGGEGDQEGAPGPGLDPGPSAGPDSGSKSADSATPGDGR